VELVLESATDYTYQVKNVEKRQADPRGDYSRQKTGDIVILDQGLLTTKSLLDKK
jgi:hypothetical protein